MSVPVIAALAALVAFSLPAQAIAKRSRVADNCAATSTVPTRASTTVAEDSILCLLNNERASRGLRKLRLSHKLASSAQFQSQDMIDRHYFEHQRRGGPDLVKRIKRTGYFRRVRSWSVGENIAWGTSDYATPSSLVKAWMESSGHRENILNPDFREIGVGLRIGAPTNRWDSDEAATATTDFGMRIY
jgi:uncharacterized protein YkwD